MAVNNNTNTNDSEDEIEETEVIVEEAGGHEEVNHVLDVCGISNKESVRTAFVETEGLRTIASFGMLEGDKDVKDMCARLAGRAKTKQVIIGTVQMKCLQALVYWVRDQIKHNQDLNHNNWTVAAMNTAMEEKEMERSFKDVKLDIIDPGKCKTGLEWDDWQTAFENKMESTYGVGGMPISYVIRPKIPRGYVFRNKEEENKYLLSHSGPTYTRNNKMVYAALKAACLNTEAWA